MLGCLAYGVGFFSCLLFKPHAMRFPWIPRELLSIQTVHLPICLNAQCGTTEAVLHDDLGLLSSDTTSASGSGLTVFHHPELEKH